MSISGVECARTEVLAVEKIERMRMSTVNYERKGARAKVFDKTRFKQVEACRELATKINPINTGEVNTCHAPGRQGGHEQVNECGSSW